MEACEIHRATTLSPPLTETPAKKENMSLSQTLSPELPDNCPVGDCDYDGIAYWCCLDRIWLKLIL